MVRKVITMAVCLCLLFCGSRSAQATAYTPYDGSISSTYITYFKDIVSGIGFNDNYVAFRSGQYEYVLIIGQFNYADGVYTLEGSGTAYAISNDGSYNSYQTYSVSDVTDVTLTPGDKIIYSDLGQYPQLIDRGSKYEMLNTVLLVSFMLMFFVLRIFSRR